MAKKKISSIIIILLLIISYIIIVGINIFHYYYNFNADIASEAVLARVVWESKQIVPNTWYPSSETRIIGTPNLAALFYGLTGNMRLSMGISCSMIVLMVILSNVYMMRKWGCSFTSAFVTSILLLLLPANNTIMELWLVCACYYGNCVIIFLITMGIYGDVVKNKHIRWYQYIISILLAVLIGLQGMRGMLVIYGPLVVMELIRACLLFIRTYKTPACGDGRNFRLSERIQSVDRVGLIWSVLLAIATYIGTKAPFSTGQSMGLDLGNGIEKLFSLVIPGIGKCIGLIDSSIWTVVLIVFCLCVLLFNIIKFSVACDSKVILLLFGLLSLIMTGGCIAFTTVDNSFRYYFALIIVMAIAVGMLWDKYSEAGWSLIVLAICLFAFCIRGTENYMPIYLNDNYRQSSEYQVAEYLEAIDVDRACATFERANSIFVYSNGEVLVRTVASMSDMKICYWLNNSAYFPDKVPEMVKTAYIVSEGEKEGFETFVESVDNKIVLDTQIGGYYVYLSDYDYANKYT